MMKSKNIWLMAKAFVVGVGLLVACRHAAPSGEAPVVEELRASWISAADQSCTQDDDCEIIEADCCGCNQGGKQSAIARRAYDVAHAQRAYACAERLCMQMIGKDKSCLKKKAKCVNQRCSL